MSTMQNATVTGLCRARCVAGDVTISISFTRPVPVDQPLGCPLCGEPLTIVRSAEKWASELANEYPFSMVHVDEAAARVVQLHAERDRDDPDLHAAIYALRDARAHKDIQREP